MIAPLIALVVAASPAPPCRCAQTRGVFHELVRIPPLRGPAYTVWMGSKMAYTGGLAGAPVGAIIDACSGEATRIDAIPPEVHSSPIWTGRELLFVGNAQDDSHAPYGFRYDPRARSWARMNLSPVPSPSALGWAWVGGRLLAVDGLSDFRALYDPDTDAWTQISKEGAPPPRSALVTAAGTSAILRPFDPRPGATPQPIRVLLTRSNTWRTGPGSTGDREPHLVTNGWDGRRLWFPALSADLGRFKGAFWDVEADRWTRLPLLGYGGIGSPASFFVVRGTPVAITSCGVHENGFHTFVLEGDHWRYGFLRTTDSCQAELTADDTAVYALIRNGPAPGPVAFRFDPRSGNWQRAVLPNSSGFSLDGHWHDGRLHGWTARVSEHVRPLCGDPPPFPLSPAQKDWCRHVQLLPGDLVQDDHTSLNVIDPNWQDARGVTYPPLELEPGSFAGPVLAPGMTATFRARGRFPKGARVTLPCPELELEHAQLDPRTLSLRVRMKTAGLWMRAVKGCPALVHLPSSDAFLRLPDFAMRWRTTWQLRLSDGTELQIGGIVAGDLSHPVSTWRAPQRAPATRPVAFTQTPLALTGPGVDRMPYVLSVEPSEDEVSTLKERWQADPASDALFQLDRELGVRFHAADNACQSIRDDIGRRACMRDRDPAAIEYLERRAPLAARREELIEETRGGCRQLELVVEPDGAVHGTASQCKGARDRLEVKGRIMVTAEREPATPGSDTTPVR